MSDHGRPGRSSAPRILGWTVLAIVILAALGLAGARFVIPRYLETGTPETHLIPETYRGWVTVKYGIAGTPPLPLDGGALVFRYPDSGVLETSTEWAEGMRPRAFFAYGASGETPLARTGPQRRVWMEHDIALGAEDGIDPVERRSAFFVGTRKEYKAASRLPPLLEPGAEGGAGLPPGTAP